MMEISRRAWRSNNRLGENGGAKGRGGGTGRGTGTEECERAITLSARR